VGVRVNPTKRGGGGGGGANFSGGEKKVCGVGPGGGGGGRAGSYTSGTKNNVSMLDALCRWERLFARDEVSVGLCSRTLVLLWQPKE